MSRLHLTFAYWISRTMAPVIGQTEMDMLAPHYGTIVNPNSTVLDLAYISNEPPKNLTSQSIGNKSNLSNAYQLVTMIRKWGLLMVKFKSIEINTYSFSHMKFIQTLLKRTHQGLLRIVEFNPVTAGNRLHCLSMKGEIEGSG